MNQKLSDFIHANSSDNLYVAFSRVYIIAKPSCDVDKLQKCINEFTFAQAKLVTEEESAVAAAEVNDPDALEKADKEALRPEGIADTCHLAYARS